MQYVKNDVKVEWVDLGEGLSGDYDPNDLTDLQLLRFDVSKQNPETKEWKDPGDASYCTLMPVDTPKEMLMIGLKFIMDEVYEPLHDGFSIKKICEQLSWIEPSWIKEGTIRAHLFRST